MSQEFGRNLRLRTRAEFTLVQDGGRRVSTRHFTLFALPNALDRDRLGIIASRRVGGAVVRNRAKRRIREIFRSAEPDRSTESGARALDVVVIARREMIAAPFVAVASEFASVVKRLRGAR